jgi:hypothetical protein
LLAVARDATIAGRCRVTLKIVDENTAAVLRAETSGQTPADKSCPGTSSPGST